MERFKMQMTIVNLGSADCEAEEKKKALEASERIREIPIWFASDRSSFVIIWKYEDKVQWYNLLVMSLLLLCKCFL